MLTMINEKSEVNKNTILCSLRGGGFFGNIIGALRIWHERVPIIPIGNT
jgi:hypothetical protein